MSRLSIGVAALTAGILASTVTLAQTVPSDPSPMPSDPNVCDDETMGAGLDCVIPDNPAVSAPSQNLPAPTLGTPKTGPSSSAKPQKPPGLGTDALPTP